MIESLKSKKLVIIGGTSGIGQSTRNALIKYGAKVVVVGLKTDEIEEEELIIIGDVLEESVIDKAINLCVQKFGGFDGLFHVVGGSGRKWGDGPVHELTNEGWDKTIELNLKSVMLSNRAAIRYFMKHKQKGVILNTSSVLAGSPSARYFHTHAYSAAKAGIIGFSKSIAAYYSSNNIRVNVLAPGLSDTPMAKRAALDDQIQTFIKTKQPLDNGRMARVTDIDTAACFFLSDKSAFITGQVLAIDGGWSISDGQY